MDIEQAVLENKLAEQEITRQSLEDKTRRIWELEKKVELLEDMLNRMSSVRVHYPQPQPARFTRHADAPRRWSVKS
jgi:hypothetical protein